jgi:hypothetical protein
VDLLARQTDDANVRLSARGTDRDLRARSSRDVEHRAALRTDVAPALEAHDVNLEREKGQRERVAGRRDALPAATNDDANAAIRVYAALVHSVTLHHARLLVRDRRGLTIASPATLSLNAGMPPDRREACHSVHCRL